MLSSCRLMPDSADSIGYGTRTPSASGLPIGGLSRFGAPANSQTPLRFCHSVRTSCGRGYSGRALEGDTWDVQGVVSGGVFGTHSAACAAGTTVVVAIRIPTNTPRTRLVMGSPFISEELVAGQRRRAGRRR